MCKTAYKLRYANHKDAFMAEKYIEVIQSCLKDIRESAKQIVYQ